MTAATKTIAIVGAGPGVGYAIAQRFGREGFKVALVSRTLSKLEELVKQLGADGIEAAAFTADVCDHASLAGALDKAKRKFGSIDVLEYSPTSARSNMRAPLDIDVASQQYMFDFTVLGAIAAVRKVLPDMIAKGDGGLLFTTPASVYYPIAMTANLAVASGALLNYVRLLNTELRPKKVFAGLVAISGLIVPQDQAGGKSPHGLDLLAAEDVAELHFDMFTKRDRREAVIGDTAIAKAISGGDAGDSADLLG